MVTDSNRKMCNYINNNTTNTTIHEKKCVTITSGGASCPATSVDDIVTQKTTMLSILNPSDNEIRAKLSKKPMFCKALLAVYEETCYLAELAGRLGIDSRTLRNALTYLEGAGLIVSINDSSDFKISSVIKAKKTKVKNRLNRTVGYQTLKRMIFYKITEKGGSFVEFTANILQGNGK